MPTTELDEDFLSNNHITQTPDTKFLLWDAKTFEERKKSFRNAAKMRCWTIFGNEMANQVHEVRQLPSFSIPKLIFEQYLYTISNFSFF